MSISFILHSFSDVLEDLQRIGFGVLHNGIRGKKIYFKKIALTNIDKTQLEGANVSITSYLSNLRLQEDNDVSQYSNDHPEWDLLQDQNKENDLNTMN